MSLLNHYVHLDLNKNELRNFIPHPVNTADKIALEASLGLLDKGFTVYDTDLKKLCSWDGTQWDCGTELDPVWTAEKGNYYTKLELQTPGSSTIDWSNLANVPTFTDTNFGNTNITFTGNRTHELGGSDLLFRRTDDNYIKDAWLKFEISKKNSTFTNYSSHDYFSNFSQITNSNDADTYYYYSTQIANGVGSWEYLSEKMWHGAIWRYDRSIMNGKHDISVAWDDTSSTYSLTNVGHYFLQTNPNGGVFGISESLIPYGDQTDEIVTYDKLNSRLRKITRASLLSGLSSDTNLFSSNLSLSANRQHNLNGNELRFWLRNTTDQNAGSLYMTSNDFQYVTRTDDYSTRSQFEIWRDSTSADVFMAADSNNGKRAGFEGWTTPTESKVYVIGEELFFQHLVNYTSTDPNPLIVTLDIGAGNKVGTMQVSDLASLIPSSDTNFANTDLTLTSSRTHSLNGYDFSLGALQLSPVNGYASLNNNVTGTDTKTYYSEVWAKSAPSGNYSEASLYAGTNRSGTWNAAFITATTYGTPRIEVNGPLFFADIDSSENDPFILTVVNTSNGIGSALKVNKIPVSSLVTSNFANTDLTFTSNRTHNLNNYVLNLVGTNEFYVESPIYGNIQDGYSYLDVFNRGYAILGSVSTTDKRTSYLQSGNGTIEVKSNSTLAPNASGSLYIDKSLVQLTSWLSQAPVKFTQINLDVEKLEFKAVNAGAIVDLNWTLNKIPLSSSANDKMMVWDSSTLKVGYRDIPDYSGTFAPISASGNYIQNQITSKQTANAWFDRLILGNATNDGASSLIVTTDLTTWNHGIKSYSKSGSFSAYAPTGGWAQTNFYRIDNQRLGVVGTSVSSSYDAVDMFVSVGDDVSTVDYPLTGTGLNFNIRTGASNSASNRFTFYRNGNVDFGLGGTYRLTHKLAIGGNLYTSGNADINGVTTITKSGANALNVKIQEGYSGLIIQQISDVSHTISLGFTGTQTSYLNAATDLKITTPSLSISNLATSGTAPSTTGTTKMVITDQNGLLSFSDIPSGGAGTPTLNQYQIGVGNASNQLSGSSSFTYDGAFLKLVGNTTSATMVNYNLNTIGYAGTELRKSDGTTWGAFFGYQESTDHMRFNVNTGYHGFYTASNLKMKIANDGNVSISNLASGGTAPTTTGTTKMVVSDQNGLLSFQNIPTGAGATPTLQQVTDVGSVTTKVIGAYAYNVYDQVNDLYGQIYLGDASYYFDSGFPDMTAVFDLSVLTSTRVYHMPNDSGIFALAVKLNGSTYLTDANGLVDLGTIAAGGFTPSGTATQYIKGDGTYGTLATVATSGSYTDLSNKPTIYSFTGLTTQYTKGDGTYATLDKAAVGLGNVVNVDTSTTTNITDTATKRFVTDTQITTWNSKQSAITTGTTTQYLRGDLSLATFPTALSSFTNDSNFITISAVTDSVVTAKVLTGLPALSNTAIAATDSILAGMAKLQGQINNKQASGSYLTAAITGIGTSGNIQNGATQTLAVGTSGTDFNISSSTNTHTFNIPDANGTTARGLVSTGAQTFGGNKTFTGSTVLSGGFGTSNNITGWDFIATISGSNATYGLLGAAGGSVKGSTTGVSNTISSANDSYATFMFRNYAQNVSASGAHPLVTQLALRPISKGTGAATITNNATLYIEDAGSGATNNYALWVDAGTTRLDGGLTLTGLSTDNTATQVLGKDASGNSVWRDISSISGGSGFTPSGTASQYIAGDGTYVTFPTAVSAFTNDSGYLTSASSLDPAKVLQTATYRFVSDTEKSTWNSKQNTITTGTTAQYLRGDLSLATFPTALSSFTNDSNFITISAVTDSVVTGKVLTGYAVGSNATLAATDTILAAFGKVQAQLNNKQASGSYEAAITAGTTSQYWRGDKSWQTLNATAVGLGNVTNSLQVINKGGGTSFAAGLFSARPSTGQATGDFYYATDTGVEYYYNGTTWDAAISAFTGDITNTAKSAAITVTGIQGKAITLATGFLKYSGSAWTFDNSTYLTANQSISFAPTGDVTGSTSGTTSLAPVLAIGTNKVTNTQLAQMAANTIKGNNTAGVANAADLTVAQIKTMLSISNVENTALSTWAGSANITTLGTIATGTWNGGIIAGQYGGTGVNNSGKTITLGGNLVTSGAFALTLTTTAATNVTLPTTGTLATTSQIPTTTSQLTNDSNYVTTTSTSTLTNKRITPKVNTVTSSGTPTPNADTDDIYIISALAVAATFGAPTGTPVEGQRLMIRIKDNGTSQTLGFNAAYRFSSDLAAPTATNTGKWSYIGFIYNSMDAKWDCVAYMSNI